MTHLVSPAQSLSALSAVVAYLQDTLNQTLEGFRRHALLYVVALGTYAIGILECMALDLPVNFGLVSVVSGTTILFLSLTTFIWLVCYFIKLWKSGYQGSPSKALVHKLATDIAAPSRVSNIIHAVLVNGIFFVGFLAIKKAIPHLMGGFTWDQTFMELDRALHLGTFPHDWLMPLLGGNEVLFATNIAYNMWFVVILFCWFWFGFAKQDSVLRQRYMLAYLLSWFVGTCVLGTVFASAGPCFYQFVVAGENPYAGLMAHMRAVNEIYPIWAVPTQETLWASFDSGVGQVEGISAMPSLHVGTSVLFVCLAFAWGQRWFIRFSIPFAAAIFFGSIILGWHYAIDGYLGAAVALACWALAGKLAPWWANRQAGVR